MKHEGVLGAGLGGELFLFGGFFVERCQLLEKGEDRVFVFFCKSGTTDEVDGHVCGLRLGRGEEFVLEDIVEMGVDGVGEFLGMEGTRGSSDL